MRCVGLWVHVWVPLCVWGAQLCTGGRQRHEYTLLCVCIWKPEVDVYFSHLRFRTGSLYEAEAQHLAATAQEAHRTHLPLPHHWCLIIDKRYPTCL